MEIARLKAVVEIDDADFRRGLKEDAAALKTVEGEATKAGASVETFGKKIGSIDGSKLQAIGRNLSIGVTAPMVASASAAVMMASSTEEALSRVNVVFGSNAKAIDAWTRTAATGFGQSRAEALSAVGDFGALFTAMEIGQGQSAKMSQTMVQLAGDLASFKDVRPEEAMVALRAGLVGESEPLRRFGVNLSEAKIQAEALKMGLISVKGEALDPSAKAQAAYNIILRETKTAQGDYNRTSDSLANTMRTMKAELSDTAAAFGKELIPAVKDALGVARDLLHTFNALPDPMKKAAGAGALFVASLGPLLSGAGMVAKIAGMFGGGGAAATGGAGLAGAGVGLGAGGIVLGGAAAVGAGAGVYSALPKELQGILKWAAPALPAGSVELAEGAARFFRGKKGAPGGGSSGTPAAAMAAGGAPAYDAIGGTGNAVIDPKELKLRSQAGDAEFAFRMQQSTNAAARGPEQMQAQREAATGVPLLTARAKEFADDAAKLAPKIRESAEANKQYWALKRDEANLIEQANKLQREAVKEVADNQKKAAEAGKQQTDNVRKFQDMAFREQMAQAADRASLAVEGQEAAGKYVEMTYAIIPREEQIAAEIKQLLPLTKTSWDAALRVQELRSEHAGLERTLSQAQRLAQEEATRNEKKAADEAKKAAEANKRQLQERASSLKQISEQVVSAFKAMNADRINSQVATDRFQEAKLANNPFLSRQQKAAEMNRLLTAEIYEKSRRVQGESYTERMDRQTDVQGLFGKVVENLGGFQRLGRRGSAQLLGQFNQLQEMAERNPVTSRAVTESQQAARQAAALAPKPMVMQLFLGDGQMSPEKLWKAFQQFQERMSRESGMIGAAG